MIKKTNYRPAFNLLGFVFGMAAGCFAISNAIISMLILLRNASNYSGFALSMNSETSIVLCVTVAIFGVLLIKGSLMVWRMSILGGAINLASGIVLSTLVFALFTISGNELGQFYFISLVETILMSIFSILSGCLALFALFEQVEKRFAPLREPEFKSINIAVSLPSGGTIQIGSKDDATVGEIKKSISEKEGKAFYDAAVIFHGKKVTNEQLTLKEVGIKDGDKITLV